MSRRSLARHGRFLRETPEGGGGGTPPTPAKPELTWDELRSQFEEQGLNPGQIRGRLDASRKWEDRAKAAPKPDEIEALREKAARVEALEYELSSDKEKAVADAKKAAQEEARSAYVPRLVSAEFRAAAAGRLEPERLATILEPLDLSKFLTDSGDVDTDKVSAFVDGIAPARGTETPPQRRGPSTDGLGRRESTTTTASVAAGRELYRSRHPQKTS